MVDYAKAIREQEEMYLEFERSLIECDGDISSFKQDFKDLTVTDRFGFITVAVPTEGELTKLGIQK